MITATNELIRLIGQETYDSIVNLYESADPLEPEQAHLLYVTRYPIAIRAYRLFAENNDVAHTTNGRKMKAGEGEKQAFEWQLDRDNKALERRYYRALDELLRYLDANVEAWKETDEFKATHKLFIRTTEEFDEHFRIESRYTLLQLMPGIRQCEHNEILPRIGPERYDALKAKVMEGTALTEVQDIKLLYLIRGACAYHALAWAMHRLSVQVFPEGVLQQYTSDRETTQIKRPAAKSEVEVARQAFTADAERMLAQIEVLLKPATTTDCEEPLARPIITGPNFLST